MLYGIGAVPGNRVRFGVTSTELNQNLNLSPENKTAVLPLPAQPEVQHVAQSPAQTTVQPAEQATETEAPKKRSHKFLKTIGVIAVLAAGAYALVKSGKLANIFNKKEVIDAANTAVQQVKIVQKVENYVDSVTIGQIPKRISRRYEAYAGRKQKPEYGTNKRDFRKGR